MPYRAVVQRSTAIREMMALQPPVAEPRGSRYHQVDTLLSPARLAGKGASTTLSWLLSLDLDGADADEALFYVAT